MGGEKQGGAHRIALAAAVTIATAAAKLFLSDAISERMWVERSWAAFWARAAVLVLMHMIFSAAFGCVVRRIMGVRRHRAPPLLKQFIAAMLIAICIAGVTVLARRSFLLQGYDLGMETPIPVGGKERPGDAWRPIGARADWSRGIRIDERRFLVPLNSEIDLSRWIVADPHRRKEIDTLAREDRLVLASEERNAVLAEDKRAFLEHVRLDGAMLFGVLFPSEFTQTAFYAMIAMLLIGAAAIERIALPKELEEKEE